MSCEIFFWHLASLRVHACSMEELNIMSHYAQCFAPFVRKLTA